MAWDPHPDWLGPVDLLAVALPPTGGQAGVDALLALVDAHQVRLLDVEAIRRDGDAPALVDLAQVPGVDLSALVGATTGLLDDDDRALIAADLAPGVVALAVVYEVLVTFGVVEAFAAAGGVVLAEGPVLADDLDVALTDVALTDDEEA